MLNTLHAGKLPEEKGGGGKKDAIKYKFLALGLLSFKTNSENLIGSSRHALTRRKYDAPRAHLSGSTTIFF